MLTRFIVGPSIVFGIPYETRPAESEDSESVAGAGLAEPTRAPVVELVARLGGVYVDAPTFKNTKTREVKVKNEVPRFTNRWGFGLDMEANIPAVVIPGYVVLRGSLNAGFDPNTWGLQVGYTIPFANLISGIGGPS